MGKTPLENPERGRRRVVKGMSFKKLQALMDSMETLYGPKGREMTFDEVNAKHPDLIAKLDGDDVKAVLGVDLTTDQIDNLDRAIDVGTTVRDAREKVFGKFKKEV